MIDPEIQQAAEFLAEHSVLLLGLGMLVAAVSLIAIALAVRLSVHVRGRLRVLVDVMVRAHDIPPLRQFLGSRRARAFIPNAYLALHLALGMTATAAVTIFVILTEHVAGGGALAAFDVTFAHALWNTATPGWQRIFAVVSWMGSREVLGVAAL